jgi:ABC-type branched-subunit amino acid transport system substrate-binding protein
MRHLIRCIAALAGACLMLGAQVQAQAQELVLAQVASQTNLSSATNAKGMAVGIKAYFDAVNAAGGVNGRQLKLVTKDDDLNAGKMVAITKELIADKDVLALVGFLNSGGLTELAKANVPGEAGIAMIAPLQGNKNIVGADNFFPFRSGYTDEVTALVNEAKNTQKKRVAIFYYNTAFGPPMSQFAQTTAKNAGLDVVANVGVDVTPEKFEANMKAATLEVAKTNPEAVFIVAAGRFANEFVKLFRDTPAGNAQLYTMSVVLAEDVVKAAGAQKARGMVIAQATPFPFSPTLPLVSEYQRLMKQYAPGEAVSFSSLEGFIGAKITVEALKRAGPNPTRDKIVKALNNFGEWNLGGVYVNYGPKGRSGWGSVDLTIVGSNGSLMR